MLRPRDSSLSRVSSFSLAEAWPRPILLSVSKKDNGSVFLGGTWGRMGDGIPSQLKGYTAKYFISEFLSAENIS